MKRGIARSLVAAVWVAGAVEANAALFVFGDSVSDAGNAAALTQVGTAASFFPPSAQLFPPDPRGFPYNYRFSNGPVAVEYLALLPGFGGAPSTPAWPAALAAPGNNYAVGGAMTGVQFLVPGVPASALCCNYNWLVNSPDGLQTNFPAVQFTGINNQIDLFDARNVPFDPASSLFFVWGGPNDIFLALALIQQGLLSPSELPRFAVDAATNLAGEISRLALLDALHFIVPGMSDLGATPAAAALGLQTELTGVSMLFNATLAAALDPLQAAGLDIVEFDTFAALRSLIASGNFNSTTPCFDDGNIMGTLPNVVAGCPGYLFFDGVHPTTAVNAILAAQIALAVPEPRMLALLCMAFAGLGFARRYRLR